MTMNVNHEMWGRCRLSFGDITASFRLLGIYFSKNPHSFLYLVRPCLKKFMMVRNRTHSYLGKQGVRGTVAADGHETLQGWGNWQHKSVQAPKRAGSAPPPPDFQYFVGTSSDNKGRAADPAMAFVIAIGDNLLIFLIAQ
jgi:hypothetical protein